MKEVIIIVKKIIIMYTFIISLFIISYNDTINSIDNEITSSYTYWNITMSVNDTSVTKMSSENLITPVGNKGCIPYECYYKITDKTSKQYELLQNSTDSEYGIRIVNGRYTIAVGLAYGSSGDYIDVYLKNGKFIPCIICDSKAIVDTDENNRYDINNGSIVEVIVTNDYSNYRELFDSPIAKIELN